MPARRLDDAQPAWGPLRMQRKRRRTADLVVASLSVGETAQTDDGSCEGHLEPVGRRRTPEKSAHAHPGLLRGWGGCGNEKVVGGLRGACAVMNHRHERCEDERRRRKRTPP